MDTDQERANLLTLCRAVMPGVAGVVLATSAGSVVAHETARVADPQRLAAHAVTHAESATSALVPDAGGLYLVVFVPPPLVEQWTSSAMPALPA